MGLIPDSIKLLIVGINCAGSCGSVTGVYLGAGGVYIGVDLTIGGAMDSGIARLEGVVKK